MSATTMLSFYDQRRPSTRYWGSFATLCAGWCLDFFDFYIVGFLVASLGPGWHLTYLQSSIMLLGGGLGSIVGALLFGALGDKFGRKPMLIAATVTCALGAGALALVPEGNWPVFSLLRILVGAGLGGIGTLQLVMIVEMTPTPMRVKLLGWPIMLPSVGTLLAALTSAGLMEVLGWRGVAAFGLLPLLLVVPFALVMPESPRWLLARGRTDEARRSIAALAGCSVAEVPPEPDAIARAPSASLAELYRRPGRFWLTVLIWLTMSTAGYGVYLWGPTITSMLLSIEVAAAARYFVWISLAGLAGRALFSYLPARIGRVWSGRLLGFGIAVFLGLAALFHDSFAFGLPVFVLALAAGAVFYDGGYCTLSPYMAEIFPTRLAARGSGLAQSANGLGKILGPLCLALIAGSDNLVSAKATEAAVLPAFLFLASCGLLLAICFFFAPETKDATLSLDEDGDALGETAAGRAGSSKAIAS
ncbi:MFS transporter [Inquilinus sp. CA228]|uniref:MFS transporter n=1 Tax=Inquilinus sp. CA228 TaxID=3455609 RepID=UPI003F8D55EF